MPPGPISCPGDTARLERTGLKEDRAVMAAEGSVRAVPLVPHGSHRQTHRFPQNERKSLTVSPERLPKVTVMLNGREGREGAGGQRCQGGALTSVPG